MATTEIIFSDRKPTENNHQMGSIAGSSGGKDHGIYSDAQSRELSPAGVGGKMFSENREQFE